jgi:hypothetical protein
MFQIQHGDVLIKKVNKLPENCLRRERRGGRVIVAAGETTGHAHTILDKGCVLWELKGELYLEATDPVTITHEEHRPLAIPPGIYQIGTVKEYDYFADMERNVVD